MGSRNSDFPRLRRGEEIHFKRKPQQVRLDRQTGRSSGKNMIRSLSKYNNYYRRSIANNNVAHLLRLTHHGMGYLEVVFRVNQDNLLLVANKPPEELELQIAVPILAKPPVASRAATPMALAAGLRDVVPMMPPAGRPWEVAPPMATAAEVPDKKLINLKLYLPIQ